MDTNKAARLTSEVFGGRATRDPDGKSIEHAAWMLQGIAMGYVQHEKAHRWLGYAQAIFVAEELLTLNDVKEINKSAGE